jgi:hypothetical protein
MGQQILRAAVNFGDAAAFNAGGKILGKRKPQIGPPLLQPRHAHAFHLRRKSAPDCLDLGKLWHCALLLHRCERDAHRFRRARQAFVISGKLQLEPASLQKQHGREMDGIQRAQRDRERLEGAL